MQRLHNKTKENKTALFAKGLFTVFVFGIISFINTPVANATSVGGGDSLAELSVTCSPSAAQIRPDVPVTWTATVAGTSGEVFYRWDGVNITNQNLPSVSASYGSVGTKEATVTVVSAGQTVSDTCSVSVRAVTTSNTNNNSSNNNNNSGSNNNQGTPPDIGESRVEEDSPARRLQGEGQSSDQLGEQLQQVGQAVLECTIKNMLGQGLGNIMSGLQNVVGGVVDKAVEGVVGSVLGGGGQAVPVDTVSINDYQKGIAAKETGLPSAGGLFQAPSMDSIAYCLANQVVKYTSEGAARWMNTGYDGNPTYIENPKRYFNDVQQLETEKFIQEYSAKPGFSQTDQVVLNQIIQEQKGGSHMQQDQPVNENEPWIDQFVKKYADPSNSVITRGLNARKDLESRQTSAVKIAEFEGLVNEGNISKKNPETGDVEVPGIVAGRQAQTRIELPEQKLSLLDEIGEALEALFEQVFNAVPGLIIQQFAR